MKVNPKMTRTGGSRFAKGTGCYRCESCKRKTRAVDQDAASVGVCAQCYEIAGIENSIADGALPVEHEPRLSELRAFIVARGGKL